MDPQLLIEHFPLNLNKQVISESLKGGRLTLEGVIQRADAKNQNGRVYPKQILEREIQKYIDGPVAERRAIELNSEANLNFNSLLLLIS